VLIEQVPEKLISCTETVLGRAKVAFEMQHFVVTSLDGMVGPHKSRGNGWFALYRNEPRDKRGSVVYYCTCEE